MLRGNTKWKYFELNNLKEATLFLILLIFDAPNWKSQNLETIRKRKVQVTDIEIVTFCYN